MNRPLIGSLTVFLATALLVAQTPGEVEKAKRINRRAQQMREQLGKGKQLKSHVRVQVRLKNGNRLRGVVKDGRLVERVNGLRFVDAHAADKGAGIRLWYSGGTRNYVFVPFSDLQTYNVLQRLTSKQLAEIEAEMQMQEVKRAEQLRKQQQPARTGKPGEPPFPVGETGGEAAPPTGGADAKPGVTAKPGAKPATDAQQDQQETDRKWFKLLQDFPPDQGWNVKKRDEIARRFKVIGARPSEKEQRFVDEFDEWKKACSHFGASVQSDEPKQDDPTGRKSRRSRRSSRKK